MGAKFSSVQTQSPFKTWINQATGGGPGLIQKVAGATGLPQTGPLTQQPETQKSNVNLSLIPTVQAQTSKQGIYSASIQPSLGRAATDSEAANLGSNVGQPQSTVPTPIAQNSPVFQMTNSPNGQNQPVASQQQSQSPIVNPNTGRYNPTSNVDYGSSLYGRLIQGLVSSSNVDDLKTKAQGIADATGKEYASVGKQGASAAAGYMTTGTSPVGEGNAAIQRQTTAAQQTAIAEGGQMQLQGVEKQLEAQKLQQSGIGSATLASKPEAGVSFFGNPVTGNVVGTNTGGASTGNSLIDTTVDTAVQQLLSGSDANTAMVNVNSLKSPQAINALVAKMRQYDPNWTIGGSNVIAEQNYKQLQTYTAAASDLDTGLKNLDNISQTAFKFLQSEPMLNSTQNPDINNGINTFVGKFKNPQAKMAYDAVITDIQKFQAQILASYGGTTPTDVTSKMLNLDPGSLNYQQLGPYMQFLAQLGNNQKSVLQSQINDIRGSGTQPFTGGASAINTNPIIGPNSTTNGPGGGGAAITNPYVQAGFGGLYNAGSNALDIAKHVFGAIF